MSSSLFVLLLSCNAGQSPENRFRARQRAMADSPESPRRRARALGIRIGQYAPGRFNAITDVPGVRVGHSTVVRGSGPLRPGEGPVRTGVTAILPHAGNVFTDRAVASGFVLNGAGEV